MELRRASSSNGIRQRVTESTKQVKSEANSDVTDEVMLSSGPQEASILTPQTGKEYKVNNSQPRQINVSFDDKAVAFFENGGLKIDLETAQIVTQDGRRVPLDHRAGSTDPREMMAVQAGYKLPIQAEPWQFRVPGIPTQVFGKPHGVHVAGAAEGFSIRFKDASGELIDRVAPDMDDFQGLRVDQNVFRRSRQSTLGKLASHIPVVTERPSLPFVDQSIENVTFRSPTEVGLSTTKKAFQGLLGAVIDQRAESLDFEKLKVFENEVQTIIDRELEAGGDVDGFAAMRKAAGVPEAQQALRDICGEGSESLAADALLGAVMNKAMRACPLEIVVIPENSTALDCVDTDRPGTIEQLKRAGRAYFLQSNPFAYRMETGKDGLPPQRLFIGEEILKSELGVNAVLKHEMLHVFEQLYATPEEVNQIDTSYRNAKEFQSLYGVNRDEYLTTVGEEFFGTHGPDGPDWVRREHLPVYDLLSALVKMGTPK